jgi:hypothetical protein
MQDVCAEYNRAEGRCGIPTLNNRHTGSTHLVNSAWHLPVVKEGDDLEDTGYVYGSVQGQIVQDVVPDFRR